MRDKGILRRRRLVTLSRKRITSYYTAAEQREIADAAAARGISLSAFVADAALKEARKTISREKTK